MYDLLSSESWFGELRTSGGDVVVVYDNSIPSSSSGRICLFNTARGSLIEYVEEIVKSNLFDLGDQELKEAKKKYGKIWKAEKSKYLSRLGGGGKPVQKKMDEKLPALDFIDEEGDEDIEFNTIF